MESYFAFISYKRGGVDEKVAHWVHSKLEKYPYPTELVDNENRPADERFIRRVYIDVKELNVTEDNFTNDIKYAIERSRYLLIICSKAAAKSNWVNLEVSYFLKTHNNDTSKILPIFIDTVENGLPAIINNSKILSRHCPVYNSLTESNNEVNIYCFYHIVSFLLKVDFQKIYDRYRLYTRRKRRQKHTAITLFYSLICIVIILLLSFIRTQHKSLERQSHIVRLEKEIFPYSVVTGYVDNFILPTIEYLKTNEPNAHIYVHMPTRVKDIEHNHKDRFTEISKHIATELSVDSIRRVHLKTSMPRGSILHKIYSGDNKKLDGDYIDFASTTSTFLAIANKKKSNPAYEDIVIDDVIKEYTEIFIQQARDLLIANDTTNVKYVSFVTSLSDINK